MVREYTPAVWSLVLPPATLLFSILNHVVSAWGWRATAVHTQGLPGVDPSVTVLLREQERCHLSLMRASLVGTLQWGREWSRNTLAPKWHVTHCLKGLWKGHCSKYACHFCQVGAWATAKAGLANNPSTQPLVGGPSALSPVRPQ